MAKIISRKKQNDVYQRLVRIIAEFLKLDSDAPEIRDVIGDAFDIALIVGDYEMLEALENLGKDPTRRYMRNRKNRIEDKLSNLVDLIDDMFWRP